MDNSKLSGTADAIKARLDAMVGGEPLSMQQVEELRFSLQQVIDGFNQGHFRKPEKDESTKEETDMAQQYQGKTVRTIRDAKQGDPGFVANTDQVVITLDDGSEKTVKRSEVTGQPPKPAPAT